jgi:hypothetical protein
MVDEIVSNNLIYYGEASGFEVRVVNNYNAYDWLTP